ncbi:hypothetical protein BC629DRAFT_197204 [Irpex lacteus]|nr:hypothetical protein BC629DRAFT_197204 [Irpex lacteus]
MERRFILLRALRRRRCPDRTAQQVKYMLGPLDAATDGTKKQCNTLCLWYTACSAWYSCACLMSLIPLSRPTKDKNRLLGRVDRPWPIVASNFCRARDRYYLPRSFLEPSITLCLLSDLTTILTFSEHEAKGYASHSQRGIRRANEPWLNGWEVRDANSGFPSTLKELLLAVQLSDMEQTQCANA